MRGDDIRQEEIKAEQSREKTRPNEKMYTRRDKSRPEKRKREMRSARRTRSTVRKIARITTRTTAAQP